MATITGGAGADTLEAPTLEGAVTIHGGGGNDTITGGAGADLLTGGPGDDSLLGGAGDDVIYNGEVSTSFWFGTSPVVNRPGGVDTIDGGDGIDKLYLFGVQGPMKFDGREADGSGIAAVFSGGEAAGWVTNVEHFNIVGGSWADTLTGGAGNDTLFGEYGADVLVGADGDDLLYGEQGANTLTGGAGADTFYFLGQWNAVDVITDFEKGVDKVQIAGQSIDRVRLEYGPDTSTMFWDWRGSSYANKVFIVGQPDAREFVPSFYSTRVFEIYGGDTAETIYGGLGADTLYGAGGSDTLHGDAGADNLIGGEGDDLLYGDGGDDRLHVAQGGADQAYGGEGADIFQYGVNLESAPPLPSDTVIDGGAGIDTIDFGLLNAAVNIDLAVKASLLDIGFGRLSQTDIENVYGGAGDDRITGDDDANLLAGRGGADTLQGGSGADTLMGGTGDDSLDGGGGIDTVTYAAATSGVTVSLALTTAQNTGGDGIDTLKSVEILLGSAHADSLTGGAGNDTLIGGTGDDSLDGGQGFDTVSYAGVSAGVSVSLALTTAQDTGGDGVDALKAIEALIGSIHADSLTGGTGADLLNGGLGADTLDGGAGKDTLIGGGGDDLFRIDNGQDVLQEALGSGYDTAIATVGYGLAAGVSVELLQAVVGNSALNLAGNEFAQTLIGNAGINTLDGKGGADTMIGGAGNDTYLVDNTGDAIVELAGEGYDTVKTAASTYVLGAHLEVLTYTGGAAFKGTGNDMANVITGGIGIDLLDGGAGADRLIGGLGNDSYVVDSLGDVVVEYANEGLDTVRASLGSFALGAHIENLTFSGTGNFAGFGNALANVITGGAGNDTLDGAAGADRLVGGLGDDVYFVDVANDTVVELAGQGNDRMLTKLNSAAAAANVETLVFIGTGDFKGYAHAAGSTIFGAAGADSLTGGTGADFLGGMAGADTLTGNGGADIFYFDGPNTGVDRITDFQSGVDHIELRANSFGLTSLADLTFVSGIAPVAASSGPTLLYDTATGALAFDQDGAGAGATTQIAILTGKPALVFEDLLLG